MAPLAVSTVELPLHIILLPLAVTFGVLPTDTVTLAVLEQPLASVPVTVYVVFEVGEAMVLVQLVQDKPVAGDHT